MYTSTTVVTSILPRPVKALTLNIFPLAYIRIQIVLRIGFLTVFFGEEQVRFFFTSLYYCINMLIVVQVLKVAIPVLAPIFQLNFLQIRIQEMSRRHLPNGE
jgi:hypothetical protein